MNLTELLDRTTIRWPQKPALVEGEIILSYAGLVQKISELASQLQALQVKPGCRIGLHQPNSINYIALTFALWRLKAVVVPIPMEYTEMELSDIIATMQLEAIVGEKPRGQSLPLQSNCFFTRLTPAVPPDNHGLNIAFIRFTSGTTSACKGVVLSHETILDRLITANKVLCIGPNDTVMWCLPMSHHFLVTIVLYLSEGATIVLGRHVFLAQPFLDATNRWHGTVLYAAPFHYALLSRDGSGAGLASVRLAVSTTCPLPQDVAVNFQTRFGLSLTQALGVIELGLVCVNDDPATRWNSVGRPLPEYALNIRNPDSDGCGEVRFAGPGFFDAYDNPWTWREQLMPDGWFATGDVGRVDEQGYLLLAGRKAAVINLAGCKVFPEEIEAVLNRHPAVRESRVFGRVHPHLGEVVEAEIVLSAEMASIENLPHFCREQLASFKIPTRFHVVPTLPRTSATGKIRRVAAAV
jgi:long-chain acyl-CoA synthetase